MNAPFATMLLPAVLPAPAATAVADDAGGRLDLGDHVRLEPVAAPARPTALLPEGRHAR